MNYGLLRQTAGSRSELLLQFRTHTFIDKMVPTNFFSINFMISTNLAHSLPFYWSKIKLQ